MRRRPVHTAPHRVSHRLTDENVDGQDYAQIIYWKNLRRFLGISDGPSLSRLAEQMVGLERLNQQRLAVKSTAAGLSAERRKYLFQVRYEIREP